MLRIPTYQMRCYTGRQGYARFDEVLRMRQRLYNAALAERRDAWKMRRASIGRFAQYGRLTLIRRDLEECRSLSSVLERGVLNRVDRAYRAFFERVARGENPGFPRFKPIQRYSAIEVDDAARGMVRYSQYVLALETSIVSDRVDSRLRGNDDLKTNAC